MKLSVINGKLIGGVHLDLDVTNDLLSKYVKEQVDTSDIEYGVDSFIEIFMRELNVDLRYDTDDSLYTLAVILECINASNNNITEFEACLSDNTPFNNISSGFVMIILCQLEANGFIHCTKYRQLTEKGKLLIWLFRHFEFVECTI